MRDGRRHRALQPRRPYLSRERQDAFAAATSHERAAAAIKEGPLRRRDHAGRGAATKGRPRHGRHRRGRPPETTVESLGKLKGAFDPDGTITAGNASQISDGGASASLVMSRARADQLGVTPLGEIIGYGQVAGPDPSLLTQPARAIRQALEHAG